MLYALAGILLVLWMAGMAMSYTIGGFIHLLLVAAIGIALLRLIRGEKPFF